MRLPPSAIKPPPPIAPAPVPIRPLTTGPMPSPPAVVEEATIAFSAGALFIRVSTALSGASRTRKSSDQRDRLARRLRRGLRGRCDARDQIFHIEPLFSSAASRRLSRISPHPTSKSSVRERIGAPEAKENEQNGVRGRAGRRDRRKRCGAACVFCIASRAAAMKISHPSRLRFEPASNIYVRNLSL